MEGAIALIGLILILILLAPLLIASSTSSKVGKIANDINDLKNRMNQFLEKQEQMIKENQQAQSPTKEVQVPFVEIETKPKVEEKSKPIEIIEEIPIPEPVIETTEEIHEPVAELLEEPIELETVLETEKPIEAQFKPELKPPPSFKEAFPKKRNLEQFIGEKLISFIGIGILVLGIFFIVKWAVDKHYINDAGKILIGLASGTILIAIAHKLSKNYRAFSSVLAGGGIAVLYFAIYQAYQSYHLLSQTAAFAVMVVITIIAVLLAIIYDKKELAIVALVGGFCTPFFVSDGSGNYQVLFTYLLILNIGMFALAYFKKWNIVNLISYAFTILIFGAWILQQYDVTKGHASKGFLFASLFYLVFFGMNIIYNIRYKSKFIAAEIGMLLSNSFLYFGVGLFFLKDINHGNYQGMFTISMAVFNFIFAYLFYKSKQIDKNLVYLLIGLVLTFLSLTGPIQLDGNYITLFWACELVLIYWLGLKSGISILKNTSVVVLILALISLSMDWNQNYYHVQVNKMPIVLNKAVVTGLVLLVSIFLKRKLVKQEPDTSLFWGLFPVKIYVSILEIVFLVLLFIVGALEVQYQTNHIVRFQHFTAVCLWIYTYAFGLAVFIFAKQKKDILFQHIVLYVMYALIFFYFYADYSITQLRNYSLENSNHLFMWHYLIFALGLGIIYLVVKFFNANYKISSNFYKASSVFISIMLLFIISKETTHLWVYSQFEPGFSISGSATRSTKVAWPVIWSLLSFTYMFIGMKHKIKLLRITSLVLFSITILKLFIYDISNVSQGGKIVAFVILGVILLLVSFMYQKIKGLFVDEEQNNIKTETHEH